MIKKQPPYQIIIVTGSYPPQPCGIGDYIFHVLSALADRLQIMLVTPRIPPESSQLPGIEYAPYPAQLAHLERFPSGGLIHWHLITRGFRMDLLFLFWMFYCRVRNRKYIQLVTLHDYRTLHPLNRVRLRLAALFCHALVGTTKEDSKRFKKWGKLVFQIPIGANLPWRSRWSQGDQKNHLRVTIYGFPHPNRLLDRILPAINQYRREIGPVTLRLIPGWTNISLAQQKKYEDMITRWELKSEVECSGFLTEDEVEQELLASDLSCLFFRDGISLRRTSFIGSAGLGIPMICNSGPSTPRELSRRLPCSMIKTVTPDKIFQQLRRFTNNPALFIREAEILAHFIQTYHSWPIIAQQHSKVYQQLCIKK